MPTFQLETPQGGKFQIDADNMTAALKAFDHVQKGGGEAAPAEASAGGESSTMGDIGKSFLSGGVKGFAGLAGMPGDIAELGTQGINYLTGSNLQNKVPLASTEDVMRRLQQGGLQLHKPEGTLGQYAQTIGEFAPGMLLPGGEASLARKAATNVIAPALASETAGQITAGTPAEPFARMAGGLVGAGIGAKALAPKVPEMTGPQILEAAGDVYKSPAIADARFRGDPVRNLSDQWQRALRDKKFNEKNAGPVFDALEELKTPIAPVPPMVGAGGKILPFGGNPTHSYEDFAALKAELQRQAGDFSPSAKTKQAAASEALTHVNNYLEQQLPQSHLAAGDANLFKASMENARHDYAAGMMLKRFADAQKAAQLGQAAANSGGNINTIRQKLKPFLATAKGRRGVPEDVQEQIGNIVIGSTPANIVRHVSNVLGGGGGLGQLGTAMSGFYLSGGNPMGLGALIPGHLLRTLSEHINQRAVNKAAELIKRHSPTYQEFLRTLPPQSSAAKRAGLLALLAAKPTSPGSQGVLPTMQQ